MDDIVWLMSQEIGPLRRYATALTNDPHLADDLVQDTLERAMRKRRQWGGKGSLRSWLFRILYRQFLNGRTARSRRPELLAANDEMPQGVTGAAQEDRMACSEISEAMQRLPQDQRAALVLTVVEGLAYDEAAQVLDIPVGTLRSRLSRAREALRHIYRPATEAGIKRVK